MITANTSKPRNTCTARVPRINISTPKMMIVTSRMSTKSTNVMSENLSSTESMSSKFYRPSYALAYLAVEFTFMDATYK